MVVCCLFMQNEGSEEEIEDGVGHVVEESNDETENIVVRRHTRPIDERPLEERINSVLEMMKIPRMTQIMACRKNNVDVRTVQR